MLPKEIEQTIEAAARRYPQRRGACIEALQVVQRHHGWVSDDSLKELARLLQMTTDELDGVATFYNLIFRKPVGTHVILLCNSISCWIMGYERLREKLTARLGIAFGETSADGRFTLLPNVCLGVCDHAPAMMVDEDLYGDVSPETLGTILQRYGCAGAPGKGDGERTTADHEHQAR